jgi:hypothetical protein
MENNEKELSYAEMLAYEEYISELETEDDEETQQLINNEFMMV